MKTQNEHTYIIAEVASAHEGSRDVLYKLIKFSSDSNADAIKFQIFDSDELSVKSYHHHDLYKKLQFTRDEWEEFIDYSIKKGLDVWIDPYDRWGLKVTKSFIKKLAGVKIPPTILSDIELTKNIFQLKCKKLVGISGFSMTQIKKIFENINIKKNDDVYIMYGFQRYPTKIEDLNLKRIKMIRDEFNMPVGYADHIDSNSQLAKIAPCVAVTFGATIIEKHITIDRYKQGLDYHSSLNPNEFKDMVKLIRDTEKMIGTGQIGKEEKEYLDYATKIVANCKIEKGEIVSRNKISYKRSDEKGLFPHEKEQILNKVALREIREEETIKLKNVKKPRICALIAVRMKSERLSRKALADIDGYTAIERVVNNITPAKRIDKLIICTSTNKQDDPLEKFAKKEKISVFRGSEDNVVQRFIDTAEKFKADIVVRVTGDSPLVSYELADYLIKRHLENGADYTCVEKDTVPIGTYSEIITTSALKKLTTTNADLKYSEYMTCYFVNNPDIFSINLVPVPDERYKRPEYRVTLDFEQDLRLIREIFKHFNVGKKAIPLHKTIAFLDKHPEIVSINKNMPLKWIEDKGLAKKLEKVTKA